MANDVRCLLVSVPRPVPGEEILAAMFSIVAEQSDPQYLTLLTAMTCRIPEIQLQLEGLIRLSEEAGISHEGPSAMLSAIVLNKQLDQLLAIDEWHRAEEILDPEEVFGVDHRALARLAQSRCRGLSGEESRVRLREVIHRLEVGAVEREDRKAKRKVRQG